MPSTKHAAAHGARSRPVWRRYIPPRVRQEARVIVASIAVLFLVLVGLGSFQLRPIVFTRSVLEPPAVIENVQGQLDLFDMSAPHTITIDISDVEYDKMVADFQRDGTKTWIRADAVIDGTFVRSIGIRLKGNSTLSSLRSGGERHRTFAPGEQSGAAGPPPSEGFGTAGPPPSEGPWAAESPPIGGMARRGGGPDAPGQASVSFDDPSTLPLLLSFDHFTKGRGYQGRAELALRPGVGEGANLNEATALELIRLSMQPSQRFTWVRLRMNGSEERTRLVIENPDQSYAERLGHGSGVLFKSTSTNRFAYLGEDPTLYAEDFSQLNAKGVLDLAPLIRFLRFIESANDADFVEQLPDWLDLASFARYVATQKLLNNFDDMSGPGRNFLVWYGVEDERFRILSWDLNLAIVGMGGMGRPGGVDAARIGDAGAPGPGVLGAPPERSRGGRSDAAVDPLSASVTMGLQGRTPENARSGAPPADRGGLGGGRGGPGGGMQHGNLLKERFVAAAAWASERKAAEDELRALWFDDGRAIALARALAARVPRTGTLDDGAIEKELTTLVKALESLARREDVETTPARLGAKPLP